MAILFLLLCILGGLFVYGIKVECEGHSRLRVFMRGLALVFIASICFIVRRCPIGRETEQASETYRFPSGEVLVNESSLERGFEGSVRHNRLFYQPSIEAPREEFPDIGEGHSYDQEGGEKTAAPISLRNTVPHLRAFKERALLVLGSHVFYRTPPDHRQAAGRWSECGLPERDDQTAVFLRSFLKKGDPERHVDFLQNDFGTPPVPGLPVKFVFHSLDFTQRLLIQRRITPGTEFPEYLAYRAPQYGGLFTFDLEQTRFMNHITPLPYSGTNVEFSVITYHGSTPDSHWKQDIREHALKLPDIVEQSSKASPLHAGKSAVSVCPSTADSSASASLSFESELELMDAVPEFASIRWHELKGPDSDERWRWNLVWVNHWYGVQEIRREGRLAAQVFVRVSRGAAP